MPKNVLNRFMFFNRGSAEPQGSASGCQGEFVWAKIHNHSFMRLWQYRHLGNCTGFHKLRICLQKVPLQQKG